MKSTSVGSVVTTDPAITQKHLFELVDDRHLQPAENITPLVRTEIVDRWGPGVTTVLDDVSRRLTTGTLREMNGAVASGMEPAAVAASWLAAERRR